MALPSSIRLPTLAKYEVVEELGHGGMATVYRAHDKRLERDVAVKVLHPHLRESVEIAHRFSAEAKAVAKLRHPNIVEVYDVSEPTDLDQYLVVELVEGCTLRTLLKEEKRLPPEVAAALAVELLHALSHAHAQGVVHRDIKPENVMVERRERPVSGRPAPPASDPGAVRSGPVSGQLPSVAIKLMDFGIAKLLDTKGVTSTGQVLGSPAHMAPEQIEGGEVDERADVFGIGVLMYECMVGHLPFEGSNPAQVLRRVLEGTYPRAEMEEPTVGKNWSVLLDRALALRVEDRFASAEAVTEAIEKELTRLGFTSSLDLLERFFESPATFRPAHEEALKKRLSDLGSDARARGDALCAAADYNRALAYAPNDPALLKLVMTMQRTVSRRTQLRRAVRPLLGILVAGALSFGLVRYLRGRGDHPELPKLVPTVTADTAVVPTPTAPATTAAVAVTRVTPALTVPKPVLTAKPRGRVVRIGEIRPPEGCLVSVDGEGARAATSGLTLSLDEKEHQLVFSCKGELCIRQTRTISAGEKDETLASVQLELKPSVLTIEGEASHKFQMAGNPGTLRAGVAISIPIRSNDQATVVTDLDTGVTRTVFLRAGGDQKVTF